MTNQIRQQAIEDEKYHAAVRELLERELAARLIRPLPTPPQEPTDAKYLTVRE
jgi:hypothetical protein